MNYPLNMGRATHTHTHTHTQKPGQLIKAEFSCTCHHPKLPLSRIEIPKTFHNRKQNTQSH